MRIHHQSRAAIAIVGAAAVAGALVPTAGALAQSGGPTIQFRTIDFPGAKRTAINGVNDHGVVVGSYGYHRSDYYGFLESGKHILRFQYPGTKAVTEPAGINDSDTTDGAYVDSSGVYHGWVRSPGGAFSPVDEPMAGTARGQGTLPADITNSGAVVGSYIDAAGVYHGFIDSGGSFTTVDAPGAGTASGQGTLVDQLNTSGVVTGEYLDAKGVYHGFVDNSDSFFAFDAPDAGTQVGGGTSPSGISNSGVVDGYTIEADNLSQGWILHHWSFIPLNAPNAGAGANQGTEPYNLDPNGTEACGYYIDANSGVHGFVAELSW